MDQLTAIIARAENLGLTVEVINLPAGDRACKVYKGAKHIFVGTDDALPQFLDQYERDRPGLFEGSIVNYKE